MNAVRQWIEDTLDEHDESALILTGWDDAIIGLVRDQDGEIHVAYDQELIVSRLMDQTNGDWEEAYGYFAYNIEGLVPNDGGPLFIVRPEVEDA